LLGNIQIASQFENGVPKKSSVIPAQAGIQHRKAQLDHAAGDGYRLAPV
jgi:hypothetical protein